MKTKKILIGIFMLSVFGIFSIFVNADENIIQNPEFTINSSTVGCVTRPGENDGHCVTDGYEYLCANRGFLQKKDCFQNIYPE